MLPRLPGARSGMTSLGCVRSVGREKRWGTSCRRPELRAGRFQISRSLGCVRSVGREWCKRGNRRGVFPRAAVIFGPASLGRVRSVGREKSSENQPRVTRRFRAPVFFGNRILSDRRDRVAKPHVFARKRAQVTVGFVRQRLSVSVIAATVAIVPCCGLVSLRHETSAPTLRFRDGTRRRARFPWFRRSRRRWRPRRRNARCRDWRVLPARGSGITCKAPPSCWRSACRWRT